MLPKGVCVKTKQVTRPTYVKNKPTNEPTNEQNGQRRNDRLAVDTGYVDID